MKDIFQGKIWLASTIPSQSKISNFPRTKHFEAVILFDSPNGGFLEMGKNSVHLLCRIHMEFSPTVSILTFDEMLEKHWFFQKL